MKLVMQEKDVKEHLVFEKWDFGFFGLPIDDRGNEASQFINDNCDKLVSLNYDANEMTLKLDNIDCLIDELDEKFNFIKNKRILIEATTLTFAEILLTIKQAKIHSCNLTVLYLEPVSYSQKRTEFRVHKREFELSASTPGYKPIPDFINSYLGDKTSKTIFIAGYESERINRGIEENSILTSQCSLVFGVPAFQVGWEMNSFANNLRVMKEQRISGDVYYSSANNPGSTYDVLENIYYSLRETEELFIAPVGPKPAGIAVALFIVENDNVSVYYDHPSKKPTRSVEVKKWHLYDIKF